MESIDTNTHVFVVKIWVEEVDERGKRARWRGYVKHAVSGKSCYVESLDDVLVFMAPYLAALGVRLGQGTRWRLWRHRRRRRGKGARSAAPEDCPADRDAGPNTDRDAAPEAEAP